MKTHYTEQYLLSPQHPVTVALIGCGGTGSSVLTGLARLDAALIMLGHPGLFVAVYDPDIVEEHNIGRQMFSPSDVGHSKAAILTSRINRAYGLNWDSVPAKYCEQDDRMNIMITCVDNAKTRMEIQEMLHSESGNGYRYRPYQKHYYWLDFGNSKSSGQVVIGTVREIEQQNGGKPTLPTIIELYGKQLTDDPQEPSCSFAASLQHQDLFINSTLANLGLNLLWSMFRDMKLTIHGFFLNLSPLQINSINIC